MNRRAIAALTAVAAASLGILVGFATAQGDRPFSRSCPDCGVPDFGYRQHYHYVPAQPVPQRVGQDALGAVQEVVGLLMSDPTTDWGGVSIARLRRHLVDMDELMLRAEVDERAVDGGLEVRIGGEGRTLEAVRRLVPAHARAMDGFRGWRIAAEDDGEVVRLNLIAGETAEVEVMRALGFYGFMASGVHHPHQLLAVARGRSERWPDPAAGG